MAAKGFVVSAAAFQPIERVPRHRDGSGFATKGEQFAHVPGDLAQHPHSGAGRFSRAERPIFESGAILQYLGRKSGASIQAASGIV
ncbi:hypothetical protein [Pseudoxanthomonas sp. X-1]|uniref:hypothetical protein n=1 Tax=Pseudoxanthomonas sp. X-1 TaxID=2571115 RepID=UPI00197E8FD1|nr:hypothetical protein [Pseudoxanthomonas sp. X-1]UAY76420.1 hypothetical protein LAJ50_09430 [Pseudoxanthomonas sp. X-1]